MKLEQGTVPRVGIGEQDRVREVRAQRVGIRDRNHLIVNAADDERGLADFVQIGKALT